jgi:hypothetical protein
MKPVPFFLAFIFTSALTGCTNYIYQGRISGVDAYNKANQFTLYWPKTVPLIGRDKAGPAIFMTDCSTTRIDFSEQPEGIVFRGEEGRDRLAGATSGVSRNQVCGSFVGQQKLVEVHAGKLALLISCEPMPADEFDTQPRNYPKAKAEPYKFHIVEIIKHWSLFGETLQGPDVSCTK